MKSPPQVSVRAWHILSIIYGFADASGRGFGSTVLGKNGTRYRIGVGDKDTEEESSNFRQFENVVLTLEKEGEDGGMKDSLVLLFTDNSTVEAALYKGNSSSPKLFGLVLRIKKLELHSGARFLVSHCAGTRMMEEGADGTSRGHLREGVAIGESMLDFIPLHLSAIERTTYSRVRTLAPFMVGKRC